MLLNNFKYARINLRINDGIEIEQKQIIQTRKHSCLKKS